MLDWGTEYCVDRAHGEAHWNHPGTNWCLDFHGDPCAAELVVYSDGNHHMALLEAVCAFRERHKLNDIFYTTTPPGPLVAALKNGGRLRLGNLCIARTPHVFISPEPVLSSIDTAGSQVEAKPLFRSRGNALLVRAGNPLNIGGIEDLQNKPIRLFLSNPETEKISFSVYRDTLRNLAEPGGLDLTGLLAEDGGRVVYGDCIHHREAPLAIARGDADCALLYYHLALRYTRLFPDDFELVPLSDTAHDHSMPEANLVSSSAITIIGDGGPWGTAFMEYMLGDEVAAVYHHHGMIHG